MGELEEASAEAVDGSIRSESHDVTVFEDCLGQTEAIGRIKLRIVSRRKRK